MSIFGFKKHTTDENDLTLRVNDLHRRVQPLVDLDRRLTQFQQTNVNRINQMAIEHNIIKGNVENLKSAITISAESKGSLVNREVFSFGNGGRQDSVGYVVMRRGHITGISLSSERASGEVRVGVLVNGLVLSGCEITLYTTPRKHDNFDKPFLVNPGSVINFVSLVANDTTVNTVASLLIEY